MRVASTGLGQNEIIARVLKIKPERGNLVLHAMASVPADWHLETSLEPQDVWPIVSGFLRPAIFWALLLSILLPWKKGREPEKL